MTGNTQNGNSTLFQTEEKEFLIHFEKTPRRQIDVKINVSNDKKRRVNLAFMCLKFNKVMVASAILFELSTLFTVIRHFKIAHFEEKNAKYFNIAK